MAVDDNAHACYMRCRQTWTCPEMTTLVLIRQRLDMRRISVCIENYWYFRNLQCYVVNFIHPTLPGYVNITNFICQVFQLAGPARPVRSTAQPGPARPGPARPGPARPGPARPGPARFISEIRR